ncbi:superinfection immunity protein [Geomicrobium sp. JCM 19039]|uniref:superinfection immunity protein n=1 Tax=Geomicrobium sp. JCM 19039 TaxID=1460636 RepID=UPI00045F24F5|nr:superinfection immunity protein [Geomicrobium sp. JCM 19039]GAK13976.1 hypothetical protein JCM19039_3863 [Geomicrobium sp. JCM 19039]
MEIFLFLLLAIGALIGVAVYFVPTIIAFARNKQNKIAILVLNLLAGWTFLGWVGSLVWALLKD